VSTSTPRQERIRRNHLARVVHDQQEDMLASAHRKVDALKARLDQAMNVAWPTAQQARRRGALDAALRNAEAELRELEAVIAMDRELEPVYGPLPYVRPSYSPDPPWKL
jgi:hypothetical protein